MAKLKVFHGLIFVKGRQLEAAVAATSQKQVADLMGTTVHEVRTWWSVGSSDEIEALCLATPYMAFVESERMKGDHAPRPDLIKAPAPTRKRRASRPLSLAARGTPGPMPAPQRPPAAPNASETALEPIETWLLENDLLLLNHEGDGLARGLNILESVQTVINAQQALIQQMREKMFMAQAGSCSCLTKTPDPKYHSTTCTYRQLADAMAMPDPHLPVVPGRRAPTPSDEQLPTGPCVCRTCLDAREPGESFGGLTIPPSRMMMVLCPVCGNKRCPHANDHHNPCTGSNEPGQPGSAYP